MTPRKPRGLRPEEKELWDKVRHSATPLHKSTRRVIKEAIEAPKRKIPTVEIRKFSVGEAATAIPPRDDILPSLSSRLSVQPVQMDQKRYGRMKRGKLSPDGRIDLHGMTTAQAHPALVGFILGAYGDGKRLILVITGKGKFKPDEGPMPVRLGVLRHQVPGWLRSAPLGPLVMQITEAHLKHGGSGAYYVYLRRRR